MPIDILMPALSPTMTEGRLARWVKHEGDMVRAGDVIAEIETDKATMEVEAADDGVLEKILIAEGTDGVAINTPIARLSGDAPAAAPPIANPATPLPPAAPAAPAAAPPAPLPASDAPRLAASPLARRIAAANTIDLQTLTPTGPHGRIVRADVDAAIANPTIAKPTASTTDIANRGADRIPLNAIRRITARRLTDAKQTIPHFYVSIDIAMDALLDLRQRLNAKYPKDGDGAYKLSVNDLLIKAAAATLARVPDCNASFAGDAILRHHHIDISLAVSIPGGLITPVIQDANQKGIAVISREAAALIARARAGRLRPEEFQGGTFSISNMGMFGISAFSAIINPPQAAILAIAAVQDRAIIRDGAVVAAKIMTATLSVDHRVIDGALAAEFLAAFRDIIEEPLVLML